MTSELTPDLAGWVIAFVGGGMVIGRLNVHERRERIEGTGTVTIRDEALSPVYAVDTIVSQDQRTGAGRVDWRAAPIAMLSSWDRLTLPMYVVRKPCAELDADDRRHLYEAVLGAEKLVQALRAGKAGLTLVPGGRH